MRIVRQLFIMRFNALDISFSVKMLGQVLTGFISSKLGISKNSEDEKWESANEHYKSNVCFKRERVYT